MAPDGSVTEEPMAAVEETAKSAESKIRSAFGRMPATEMRVEENTADEINRQIGREIEANVLYYARHIEEIDQRLAELDEEWDIERRLETTFSAISLGALALGLFSRRTGILPLAAAGFMMQHALQGWCPPLPLFRRMGARTSREINLERYALKAVRGDFQNVNADANPAEKAEQAILAAAMNAHQS